MGRRSLRWYENWPNRNCKVVIFKYVFCWLLFRAKFYCNFIQSYVPCICCENLLQELCDSEREYEDSSNWSNEGFRGYLATKHPAKSCMCPAYDWNAKSQYRWRQLCPASISQVRPSHETPARHSVLPDCTIWYTLSVPTLYISTLPTNDKECFWEKIQAKHLES